MLHCHNRLCWNLGVAGCFLVGGVFATERTLAQVTPDSTLGLEPSIVTPNVLIQERLGDRIQGGATRGSNLFHSFLQFNVNAGQRVYFANPAGISNILTRVTGGTPSTLAGTLGVEGSANLFLINPNGILFGAGARLDIAGSFVGSTASAVKFADGSEFSAVNPQAPALLAVNLTPGLQYGASRSGATIASSGHLSTGQDLTLMADRLDLQGQLQAGRNLTLAASSTVKIRDSADRPFVASAVENLLVEADRLDIFALNHPDSGFFAGADGVLRSTQTIGADAHFTTGGSFRIEQQDGSPGEWASPADPIVRAGGNVSFASYTGASLQILAGGSVTANSITINAPDAVNLTAETVTLSNGTPLALSGNTRSTLDVRAGTTAIGSPLGLTGTPSPSGLAFPATASSAAIAIGSITITPANGMVFLTNQYQPNAALPGNINVGAITVNNNTAGGSVVLDSRGAITLTGAVNTSGSATGNSGSVTFLSEGDLTLASGSSILARGALGGSVNLNSRNGTIAISGINDTSFRIRSGTRTTASGGKGGDVSLTARTLNLDQGANVLVETTGASAGGNLSLNASDSITLTSSFGDTAVFATSATGRSGDLTVKTPSLTLRNDLNLLSNPSELLTTTFGPGNAGNVTIESNVIALSGPGSATQTTQVGSLVQRNALGNAGNLTITTKSLTATDGAQVIAATAGRGNAGNVTIEATEFVKLDGVSRSFPSGIFTSVVEGATGRGGNVYIKAPTLSGSNGGVIQTTTQASQDAGNITIESDKINFDGVGSNQFASAINSSSRGTASGNGGNIDLQTRLLQFTNGARLTASAGSAGVTSSGSAGKITIHAIDSVVFDGVGSNGRSTQAQVVAFSSGRGGELEITTRSLQVTNGAQITSSTNSSGNAGNVRLLVFESVLLSGTESGVFASTAPGATGNGGQIFIDPRTLTIQDGAKVSSSSQGTGIGGDIVIRADRLTLDNQGSISADTASNIGGSIDLRIAEVLLLRHGSRISTNAGSPQVGGDGGNIAIAVPFLVSAPFENSDITANAFLGRGGNVTIAARNIFWLVPRSRQDLITLLGTTDAVGLDPVRLLTNDITAISQENPLLDGLVTITTPDVDLSRGLLPVAVDLVDASTLVVQNCLSNSGAIAKDQGEFIVVGRGGLPSSPGDALTNQSVWQDLRPPVQASQPPQRLSQQRSPSPPEIVEAQGLALGSDGEVVLTAQAPISDPHGAGLAPASCQRR